MANNHRKLAELCRCSFVFLFPFFVVLFVQSTLVSTQTPGIRLVQHAGLDAGATTSASLTFSSNNTQGNWIGICIRAGAPGEAFTVTDSKGNTYRQALRIDETLDGNTLGIFYAENIAGGFNTVTVSDSISVPLRFAILEYSGVLTSSSLDVTASATGNGVSPDSGNVTTTANGDLLLGSVLTGQAATFTAGSGYTIQEFVPAEPGAKMIAEDGIQTSAGAVSARVSLGAASYWAAGLAAFKAAAGSSGAGPSITGLSPASGPAGTSVTIAGTNFGATQGASTVTFNGTAATIAPANWSARSVVAPVPTGATSGPVVVTVGGQASNGLTFTVTAPPPNLTSLTPSSGAVGTAVTIAGSNFGATQGTSTVTFNGTAAAIAPGNWSATSIVAPVPKAATSGPVIVTVGGRASNGLTFTVVPPAGPITLVQHTSQDAGTTTWARVPFKSSNTAGNWIAVVIRAGLSGETFTVMDSNGNSYRRGVQFDVTVDVPNGETLGIFYAENIAGGANTITISDTNSATLRSAILEYSGVAIAASLDAAVAAQGNSAFPTSGNVNTTSSGDLLLGAIVTANPANVTAGSGSIIEERVPAAPGSKLTAEDQIQTVAGMASASASLAATDRWAAALAAFRAAGSSGGDVTPPTAPGNLTATASSISRIDLSWTASTDNVGVTSYRVERCSGAACTSFAQVAAPTGTTYSDAGLTSGVSYRYRVRAGDAAGNLSGYSNTASATTPVDTTPPTVSITSPANQASVSGTVTVTATASDPDSGVAFIQLHVDGSNFGPQMAGSSYSYALDTTGLTNGAHTLTAVAADPAGNQGVSPAIAITVANQPATGATGPLRQSATNPHYFVDPSGKAVLLSGSHTWNDFQDTDTSTFPAPVDFNGYVGFLESHGHNVTILWKKDLPTYCNWGAGGTWSMSPFPWKRVGPGNASDNLPAFDLSQFDPNYFSRLRSRVSQLQQNGIYAIVQLFDGLGLAAYRCSIDGYPFTAGNNTNGVDDGGGTNSMTMTGPNSITAYQDAYAQKVIDTLNDLPNVLWEISEEAPDNSTWWQNHMIALIRNYEGGKPFRHPIGYPSLMSLASDSTLYNSNADWVAPAARFSPTSSCGSGTPPCKVNINDSDHSYFGLWNDSAQTNRNYIWENFTDGASVIFMDPYLIYWTSGNRNLCGNPVNGVCNAVDARWNNFRDNLGATVSYARKMNLVAMTPQPTLSTTGYCLANPSASPGAEYLVYEPSSASSFTVALSAGSYAYEWFNPGSGVVASTGVITVSSAGNKSFTAPFSGDAVLYLKLQ